jgi:hypothetical protein
MSSAVVLVYSVDSRGRHDSLIHPIYMLGQATEATRCVPKVGALISTAAAVLVEVPDLCGTDCVAPPDTMPPGGKDVGALVEHVELVRDVVHIVGSLDGALSLEELLCENESWEEAAAVVVRESHGDVCIHRTDASSSIALLAAGWRSCC